MHGVAWSDAIGGHTRHNRTNCSPERIISYMHAVCGSYNVVPAASIGYLFSTLLCRVEKFWSIEEIAHIHAARVLEMHASLSVPLRVEKSVYMLHFSLHFLFPTFRLFS